MHLLVFKVKIKTPAPLAYLYSYGGFFPPLESFFLNVIDNCTYSTCLTVLTVSTENIKNIQYIRYPENQCLKKFKSYVFTWDPCLAKLNFLLKFSVFWQFEEWSERMRNRWVFLISVPPPIVFHSDHHWDCTVHFPFDFCCCSFFHWEVVVKTSNNSWTTEQLISLQLFLG